MDLYRQNILDHYKHPRHWGKLSGREVIRHQETNASCGDMIEIGVVINHGQIKQIKFSGAGCAISIAGTSLLVEAVQDKSIKQIKQMTDGDVEKLFGILINPARKKCATLGLVTLKKIIKQYENH